MAEPNVQDGAFQAVGAAQAGETAQAETQPQGVAQDGKGTEPTLEALQAELAASRAALAKLQNDLRANEGRRRRQGETDGELKALRDEVGALTKTVDVAFRVIGSGEPDRLPGELARVGQETATARATARSQQQLAELQDDLLEAVTDDDGKLIFADPKTAPELQEVRDVWAGGEPLKAIRLAHKVVRQHERAQSEAATAAERKAAKLAAEKARREALEEAGVFNTDTGAAAAGAQPKDLDTLVKVDTRRMTPTQLKAHDAALDAAIRRASR